MREVSEPEIGHKGLPSASTEGRPAAARSASRSAAARVIAQQAAIANIGQSALSHESVGDLFMEASDLVGRVLGTEHVSVLELLPDGSGLRVVTGLGWRPGVVGALVVGAGTGSQAGYTLATGGPVIVADLLKEDRFAVSPVLTEHGMASSMSVRIGEPDKPYGALAAFSDRAGHFTTDDANFLQAVANVLAAAIDRFRAEAEMRASRDQLAAIVSTIDEGITVIGHGKLTFANDAAAQLTGYTDAEELLNASTTILGRFDLFDADGRPMAADQLPSRRAMAGEERPEAVVGFRNQATGDLRWSVVRATSVRDGSGQVTHVINTFREITDERWSRETRAFMADAVAVLSSTLDAEEAARRLASLAVPRLADYCAVHLRGRDGSIRNVALAHSDPERQAIAERLQQARPVQPDAPTGVARAIREGSSELLEITPQLIEAAAAALTKDELDLVNRLEMRWYLSVPLMGRHGTIGALSLVMAESGRVLGQRDLALAEELGVRAGIALENAQLYQTANDRRAQLDAVLGALGEAVLVFDGDGRLQLSNSAAEEMFAGRVPTTDAELHARLGLDDDSTDDQASDSDVSEFRLDRGLRWFSMDRYRTAHDEVDGGDDSGPMVVVLREVTSARAASAARDAFLGVLSHELRTPITTIYGGSELLARGLEGARRDEVVSDIRIESERLARLVEDLLVMTRIERGTVEISDEPILVQRLLPSVVHSFNGQRPEVNVTLNLSERLSAVRGDPTYVEQVVRNLLTNAVRYGRAAEDGIEISAEETDSEISVRVLDRGQGLGEGDPEKLFELFYRSDAARAVPGGAGIGLFVCRNLIEAMGGRIWAMSREEGGAEFGFTLPVVESDY